MAEKTLNVFEIAKSQVKLMKNAFEEIWDLAEEYDVSLRTAAYMMSIKRVAIAMEKRGDAKITSESLANN
ncbi:MAG: hypothetical protein E7E21_00395 [Peptostreptococcaceae bacterium]|jgi:glutamate dehydrogenase/leucine dehydrogenase|nr:hypothetical protein [Peptostreptococcaceae bacterium]